MSHLKPEISQVNGCKRLEVGPTACQELGFSHLTSMQLQLAAPFCKKNEAESENRSLGNILGVLFKVLAVNMYFTVSLDLLGFFLIPEAKYEGRG